jgi:hypothetical protein
MILTTVHTVATDENAQGLGLDRCGDIEILADKAWEVKPAKESETACPDEMPCPE